jgi:hypothetical protein
MIIAVFTRARHWSLSWDSWMQSTPSIPISLRSILILSSHICIHSSSEWSLPFRPSNQNLKRIPHISHAHYMPNPSNPPWSDHSNNICWRVQTIEILKTQFPLATRHVIPLRSKYFPKHYESKLCTGNKTTLKTCCCRNNNGNISYSTSAFSLRYAPILIYIVSVSPSKQEQNGFIQYTYFTFPKTETDDYENNSTSERVPTLFELNENVFCLVD